MGGIERIGITGCLHWNNWVSPQRIAEVYGSALSNFTDNVLTTTRIINNRIIDAYKTHVQTERDDIKELSRLAANTAKTFENTSKEFSKINQHQR